MCRYDIREYSQNNNIHENNGINIPSGLDVSNNLIRTTSIESVATENSTDSSGFNMQGFLNTITSQLSNSLGQQLLRNDISFNNLENRFVDVEYIVENTQNGTRYTGRNRRNLFDPITPTNYINQESVQTRQENQLDYDIRNELSTQQTNNEEINTNEIIENNETDNDDDDVDTTVIY
jgi:hypothetical protein